MLKRRRLFEILPGDNYTGHLCSSVVNPYVCSYIEAGESGLRPLMVRFTTNNKLSTKYSQLVLLGQAI